MSPRSIKFLESETTQLNDKGELIYTQKSYCFQKSYPQNYDEDEEAELRSFNSSSALTS